MSYVLQFDRRVCSTRNIKGSDFSIWEYFNRPTGKRYYRVQVDEFMVSPVFETLEQAERMLREFDQ